MPPSGQPKPSNALPTSQPGAGSAARPPTPRPARPRRADGDLRTPCDTWSCPSRARASPTVADYSTMATVFGTRWGSAWRYAFGRGVGLSGRLSRRGHRGAAAPGRRGRRCSPPSTTAGPTRRKLYAQARRARQLLDAARAATAEVLGVRPDELTFTPSGTAAVRAAVAGGLAGRARAGRTLVHSAIEHSAVLHAAERARRGRRRGGSGTGRPARPGRPGRLGHRGRRRRAWRWPR